MNKDKYEVARRVPPVPQQLEQAIGGLEQRRDDFSRALLQVLRALRADESAVTALDALRLERAEAERVERWDRYFDVPKALRRSLRIAQELGVQDGAGASLLDIGCGPGFQGYVLRQLYGIESIGLDLPEADRPTSWRIAAALGQTIRPHRLAPGHPLPDLGRRFGMVTIVSPQFYRKQDDLFWTEGEWSRLFEQIFEDFLEPGGRLMMHINFNKRQGDGLYDHSDLISAVQKIPNSLRKGDRIWLPRPDEGRGGGVRSREVAAAK